MVSAERVFFDPYIVPNRKDFVKGTEPFSKNAPAPGDVSFRLENLFSLFATVPYEKNSLLFAL